MLTIASHTSTFGDIPMSANSFKTKKFVDRTILDENDKVVGHVRVKPSGILWAPANSKVWYTVDLDDFAQFMTTKGSQQTK